MAIKPIIILLVGLTLASVHPAEAQQPKKVPRIGYLSNTDPAGESTRSEAIRVAVQERHRVPMCGGAGKKVMPLTFATPGNH